jgi:hypothetical protein
MGDSLERLGCKTHWLTTWGYHAHANIGLHFDWISHPVLAEKPPPHYEGMYGWRTAEDFLWKPRAVQQFLSQPGGKVVWIDDDANGFHEEWARNGRILDLHGRLLTICPDSDIGLTTSHIEEIRNFLNGTMVHE